MPSRCFRRPGIPSTLLLDRRGRMAARVIGPVTRDELRVLILSLQDRSPDMVFGP